MLPMQAVLYLLISLINLAVSLGLLAFFVEVLHLYPVVSQTLAVGLIAIESYFLYKKFVFIAS
jgi:putative flippase GtrA